MADREIRCGVLGPGRTRNGLGPFLAEWFERAGLQVVAGAGRDAKRTAAATAALGTRLGHGVEARVGIAGLLAPGDLDVVIIATPLDSHVEALRRCGEAGVHVYCEKPLVPVDEIGAVAALTDGFAARGRVLFENCQWPEFLPAFGELYPLLDAAPQDVSMRLSPSGCGKAAFVDSLSHYLSVLQALVPVSHDTLVAECEFATRSESADGNELRLRLIGPFGTVGGRLWLERCEEQPRPAWIEVDGCRVDREIDMPGYAMFARAGSVRIPMDDPLGRLVYRFAETVREPVDDRIQREIHRIRERARLFRDIVAAW